MRSTPSRVNITNSLLGGCRLTGLVLQLSPDEIYLSEVFVPSSRMRGNEGTNTQGKSSTHKYVPKAAPMAGSTPSPFSQPSVPSQIRIGSDSGTHSPSAMRKDRTPSPRPKFTISKPTAFSWEANKLTDLGAASIKFTGGLFGRTASSSSSNIPGSRSPIPHSGGNADTKPHAFRDRNTKPSDSLIWNPKPATSLFSFASAPNAGLDSTLVPQQAIPQQEVQDPSLELPQLKMITV